MYRPRRNASPWRVLLVQVLVLLLPLAQQLAMVCCLPCVLEASSPQKQDDHREHAGLKSTCESCASCASLLAMAPPAVPPVAQVCAGLTPYRASNFSHHALAFFPFASRAPPARLA
jgi:hypothetical protein